MNNPFAWSSGPVGDPLKWDYIKARWRRAYITDAEFIRLARDHHGEACEHEARELIARDFTS